MIGFVPAALSAGKGALPHQIEESMPPPLPEPVWTLWPLSGIELTHLACSLVIVSCPELLRPQLSPRVLTVLDLLNIIVAPVIMYLRALCISYDVNECHVIFTKLWLVLSCRDPYIQHVSLTKRMSLRILKCGEGQQVR